MRSVWLSCSIFLAGCASAHDRFGDAAHYAPELGAYVVGDAKDPTVLRDPLTSHKARCAEEVTRDLPVIVSSLEALDHDLHARSRARAALFPLTATSVAAVHVGLGMFLPAIALVEPFVSPSRRDRYIAASAAYQRGRYGEARDAFRSIVYGWPDESPYAPFPREYVDLSLYYLGVCDDVLHDDREAAEALGRFLDEGTWRGEAPYRDAEARLARLDPKRAPACRSRADVALTWRRPS